MLTSANAEYGGKRLHLVDSQQRFTVMTLIACVIQPMSNSDMKWDPDNPEDTIIRNSFGNLVMISQGLNSSLKNESYEIKREHVRAYINGSKTGSIESLKLLMIYKDYETKWDKGKIREHGKKMYALLADEIKFASEGQ